jgi:hypothetical protein
MNGLGADLWAIGAECLVPILLLVTLFVRGDAMLAVVYEALG